MIIGGLPLLVSGCTGTTPGTPDAGPSVSSKPTGQPSSDPSSSANSHGAPRVTAPLDGTAFLAKPCSVLTTSQLQSLSLPGSGTSDTDGQSGRSRCTWYNRDAGAGTGFSFLSSNKNGLSDTYRGRDRFKGYFEPTEVDGYPAVFNDPSDFRAKGSCNITVGISDTLAFITSWDEGRVGAKSCDQAKQVASMVIQTIRSGG
ncbi:DUF3558 domain-containing protein [Kibdelosporangium philippinense]